MCCMFCSSCVFHAFLFVPSPKTPGCLIFFFFYLYLIFCIFIQQQAASPFISDHSRTPASIFWTFVVNFHLYFIHLAAKIKLKIHAQRRGQRPFRAHPTVALCGGIFSVSNVFSGFFGREGFKDI